MGLAASQARFLGLTARKSNTEYQGQQINQQRTTLANESASLYSQLTNLTVPTPPDIINYYSTEYSFVAGEKTYTLNSLPTRNSENGKYSFQVSYSKDVDSYEKFVNSNAILGLASIDANEADWANRDERLFDVILGQNFQSQEERATAKQNLIDNNKIFFINDTVNKAEYYKVVNNEEGTEDYYKITPTKEFFTQYLEGVKIEYSQTGDIKTVSSLNLDGVHPDSTIAVQSSKVTDDAAYNLAMNQYEIDYAEYEKTMSAINAKTEVIQQQDKSLELKLNQLDTEQNAISTEMDAVQKVIEKNVESTFKTFA